MEQNIFYSQKNNILQAQMSKHDTENINDCSRKYNPDIDDKYKIKKNERNNNNFNLSNIIYNPITGIIPSDIKSPNDLKINTLNHNDNIDKLISQKENERCQQDILYKPLQTKIVNNNIQENINNISNFDELKHQSTQINNIADDKYNNILEGLKNLGIIN